MTRGSHGRGFTLIELMIVAVIAALAMTGVVMGMGATSKARLRKSCMLVQNAIRFAGTHSVIEGTTVRIVLDFDEHELRIEETSDRVVLNRGDETGEGIRREGDDEEPENSLEGQMNSIGGGVSMPGSGAMGGAMGMLGMGGDVGSMIGMAKGEEGAMEGAMDDLFSGDISDPFLKALQGNIIPGYRRAKFEPVKKKDKPVIKKLKGSTVFLTVFSPHDPEPRTEGKAFIYFFPNGETEHVIVQMSDEDEDYVYSIELHPISGRTMVFNEAIEPEEELDELQEGEE